MPRPRGSAAPRRTIRDRVRRAAEASTRRLAERVERLAAMLWTRVHNITYAILRRELDALLVHAARTKRRAGMAASRLWRAFRNAVHALYAGVYHALLSVLNATYALAYTFKCESWRLALRAYNALRHAGRAVYSVLRYALSAHRVIRALVREFAYWGARFVRFARRQPNATVKIILDPRVVALLLWLFMRKNIASIVQSIMRVAAEARGARDAATGGPFIQHASETYTLRAMMMDRGRPEELHRIAVDACTLYAYDPRPVRVKTFAYIARRAVDAAVRRITRRRRRGERWPYATVAKKLMSACDYEHKPAFAACVLYALTRAEEIASQSDAMLVDTVRRAETRI